MRPGVTSGSQAEEVAVAWMAGFSVFFVVAKVAHDAEGADPNCRWS